MEWTPAVEEQVGNEAMEEDKVEEDLPSILLPSGFSHVDDYEREVTETSVPEKLVFKEKNGQLAVEVIPVEPRGEGVSPHPTLLFIGQK